MNHGSFLPTILFIILNATGVFSQSGSVSGTVYGTDGIPVSGALVVNLHSGYNVNSNLLGYFRFGVLPEIDILLVISAEGYKTDTMRVKAAEIWQGINLKIVLKESQVVTDEVIVSAMKYSHEVDALPYSAEVVNQDKISVRNLQTVDELMRTVPGINVTLDQISIRGSSGYSRGTGTRVLTALDGIPIYTGDTGEIIWELLPFYDIQSIEIVKGPASSLYGSSAIGGVINILSRDFTKNNLTVFKSYYGVYDKPAHQIWEWSEEYRNFSGQVVSHSNSFGNFGYSVSLKNQTNQGYRMDDYFKRMTGFVKIGYKFSEDTDLSLFSATLDQYRGNFIYWKDSRNALVPRNEDRNQRVYSLRSMNAVSFNTGLSDKIGLSIRSSFYYTDWRDQSASSNQSLSRLLRNELFFTYTINESLKNISGFEIQNGEVSSNIFQNPTSAGLGLYTQLEYSGIENLTAVGGLRYDRNKVVPTVAEVENLSPRLGLNYKMSSGISLRSSVGTAFRAPSLAEIFTTTNTSGVIVKANPSLKPEKSSSFEFGVKLRPSNHLEFDGSLFQNNFEGLIEPEVDPADGRIRFNNVAYAFIKGAELSSEFKLVGELITLNVGYTYLDTKDKNRNRELKYRSRHAVKSDISVRYNNFEIFTDARFSSKVNVIDQELIDLGIVKDGGLRVPVYVVNSGLSWKYIYAGIPFRLNFTINNLFNYNYVEIIGNLSPVRNAIIGIEIVY